MNMPPIATLKSHDRVFITGMTGSGKTFLARYLLRNVKRLIVLDSKGTLANWNLAEWDGESRRLLRRGEPVRARVLVEPDRKPEEVFESAMTDVYEATNCVLYIDELYAVVPPNKDAPAIMWAIWTRGRELGIGAWGCTQRPVWVPLFTQSEAQHFFSFYLALFDDRRRMSAFLGEQVLSEVKDEHGFFYRRVGTRETVYQPKLNLNGGSYAERTINTGRAGDAGARSAA